MASENHRNTRVQGSSVWKSYGRLRTTSGRAMCLSTQILNSIVHCVTVGFTLRCLKVASTTEKGCSGEVFAIQWLPSLLHPQVVLAARPRPDFLACSAFCVYQLSARRPSLPYSGERLTLGFSSQSPKIWRRCLDDKSQQMKVFCLRACPFYASRGSN